MEAHNIIILSIVIVEDINDMKNFFFIFRDFGPVMKLEVCQILNIHGMTKRVFKMTSCQLGQPESKVLNLNTYI